MVVFDMAGTTVNENNVVYKTLQNAINEEGFSFTLNQVLDQGAGKEKLQAIKSVLRVFGNNENEQLAEKIFQNFKNKLVIAYDTIEILPQNNAVELFKVLKENGVYVVLNTGYDFQTANSLINKLGWVKGEHYDGLITASDVKQNRPQPDMILLAMDRFQISDPTEVVKVGDSTIDIEEGKNAGCKYNIGITTGAHTKAQLAMAHPDFILDDLLELLPVLEKLKQ